MRFFAACAYAQHARRLIRMWVSHPHPCAKMRSITVNHIYGMVREACARHE
jgi:hypothetical protein